MACGHDQAAFVVVQRMGSISFLSLSAKASTIAAAIRHALTRMARLRPHLDNGNLELDTTAAERGMRAIACTLFETAKRNALDPHAWLADTLTRIPDDKITKVEDLLPWRWNAERSDRTVTPGTAAGATITGRSIGGALGEEESGTLHQTAALTNPSVVFYAWT